jgi:hypothetical protein
MVGKAQKSHGARSELNSVFGLKKVDQLNAIRTSTMQSRSCPMLVYLNDSLISGPGWSESVLYRVR